jgi:hypothetical protein
MQSSHFSPNTKTLNNDNKYNLGILKPLTAHNYKLLKQKKYICIELI